MLRVLNNTMNTSTAMSHENMLLPPTLDNPKGRTILLASCVSFALVVLFVGLRLVGRWRHRQCCALTLPEGRHNVLFSDLAIVVSLVGFLLFFSCSRTLEVVDRTRVSRADEGCALVQHGDSAGDYLLRSVGI